MKKLLFIVTCFCTITAYPQNYLITFSGSGASSTVSTVKVENLTKGTTLTVNGNDILRLTGVTGVDLINANQSSELKIYPNPMNDYSTLEIYPPVAGTAILTIYDMIGNPVAQVQSYLDIFRQDFRVSGIKNGFYIITVKGKNYQFSGKLLSNAKSDGTIRIEKINTVIQTIDEKAEKSESKGTQGTVDMAYTTGDRLKYTGSSGNFSTVITDIPTSDKTMNFNFIFCSDQDGNNYSIVVIGTQTWMAENLKTTKYYDGTEIPLVEDSLTWTNLSAQSPGYCWYKNDKVTYKDYGAYYNWSATNTTGNNPNTKNAEKICPAGWYNPTDHDWKILTDYLTNNGYGYGGSGNDIAKSLAASTDWSTSSLGVVGSVNNDMKRNNSTGFTALPSGERTSSGYFHGLGEFASWRSTSESWYPGPAEYNSDESDPYMSSKDTILPLHIIDHGSGHNFRCLLGKSLTTSGVSNLTQTTAMSGGNVKNDVGAPITERGVCWSNSPNPTITNNKTSNGTGIGIFTSSITGLTPNTTYYIRAYATNNFGTNYGDELVFKTYSGTLTDIDGNVYYTVKIGTQTWTAENLKTTKLNDGVDMPLVTSGLNTLTIPAYSWYLNDEATYKNLYGAFYNSYAVNSGKLCPAGWHVPTDAEWTILTDYLKNNGYGYGGSGSAIAKSLAAISGWRTYHYLGLFIPGNYQTINNSSGFTGIPIGSVGESASWWSTSISGTVTYSGIRISYKYGDVDKYGAGAVRCLQGELQEMPALTTTAISSITPTTALSGGNITDNESTTVSSRGVCWSTSTNPTIANNKTSDGTGTGIFTSSLTGLIPGRTYYLRAYATNIFVGTAYGNEIIFRTIVSDIDGNVYNTVDIGSQIWMIENLKTTRYSNGDLIGTTTPATLDIRSENSPKYQWAWNGIESNVSSYGRLYTGFAVTDNRNLCPTGWHVPTDADWTILTDYVGGLSVSGGKLKEAGLTHWLSPNTGATNETGFTALPGGYRVSSGGFGGLGSDGTWWSSTESDINDAWAIGMGNSYPDAYKGTNSKRSGYSVRCIKGGPALPIIFTSVVSNLGKTRADAGGNITNDGGSSVIARGVCWSTTQHPTITNMSTNDYTGIGTFTSYMMNLLPGTTYFFRAYATNSVGTAYGNEVNFTTYKSDAINDIEGNYYNIVSIGSQVWLAENLKTTKYNNGSAVPNVTDDGTWGGLTSPAFCWYNNDAGNKNVNGALYNWYAVNTGTLCPTGWNVPSDADWTTLNNYLGGSSIAGGKLKETGTTHWLSPNTGATNESGFTALPGGARSSNSIFNAKGYNGYWWSSTEDSENQNHAWNLYIMYNDRIADRSSPLEQHGFSVRCIKGAFVIPTITTSTVASITTTTATSGGNITSDGGATVIARGVCWSQSPNPTIADAHSLNGNGLGDFSSNLTTLIPGVQYYLRAYATNSIGTAYGNQVSFNTKIADVEGIAYNTVTIGTQVWMAENLKTTRYSNGDLIGTTTPATLDIRSENSPKYQWAWNGIESNVSSYGRLYTGFAVNDSRNLCPTGWHVPTDDEWITLTDYLGGLSVSGGKLKEAGLTHWLSPNTGATNETGFSALPGGYRVSNGGFGGLGSDGLWWSSTEENISENWNSGMGSSYSDVYGGSNSKRFGYSVRCIKGELAFLTDGLVAFYPFNGNANDASGNGFNGVINGAVLTTDRFGKSNSAFSFAENQDITVPNSQGQNLYPISISFWYSVTSISGDYNGSGSVFSKYTTASWNGYQIAVGDYNNVPNAGGIIEHNGFGTTSWYVRSTNDRIIGYYGEPPFLQQNISLNTWYHYVFIADSNGGKIYVNGQLIDSHAWAGTPGACNNSNIWKIGGLYNSIWFKGKIDDIRIYNRTLTYNEIQQLYHEGGL